MKYDEEKLWSSVITRAIKDAVGKNPKLKKEAINWLDSKSFETVCELANLNFKRMKSMYGSVMSQKQEKIKALLIDNIKECVSYLLPNGEFYREKTYIGNLNGNTITVKIVGKEAGDWRNFTEGTSGDIIDLWVLIKGDIDSARKWLNKKSKSGEKREREEKIFSVKQYLSDQSPIPEDIIAPRILTPGGLLVIGGTPKVGKSYFLLSLLAHLAAGVSFLKMKSARPLKIVYLQNEMEYNYIRERIQQIITNQRLPNLAEENLIVTTKMRLILNDEGIEKIKDIIKEKFDIKMIDLIVLDSLDYENIFSGLQSRIEKLRSVINPTAGVIITRHTRKVSTATLAKNPFQALIGANTLRSFYTSGIVMFQPSKRANVLQVVYELRNGKSIPAKFISRVNGHWQNSKIIATA